MSRYHSYLNSAAAILKKYDGTEPFASFLKKEFAAHKKFGSKDRKQISHLCYCFFRLGKAAVTLPVEERILAGLFLCSNRPNDILAALKPGWNEKIALPLEEKFSISHDHPDSDRDSISGIFPWEEELSNGIEHKNFCESFFIQPDLFLRLRPGKEELVRQKLTNAGMPFLILDNNSLALSNAAKIDAVIELNKEAVVQDLSSQRVGKFLSAVRRGLPDSRDRLSDRVWDCCAASGGKSIMAKDILGDIDLTVSDIRQSILINLEKRFIEAGIIKYKSFVADLATHSPFTIHHPSFDLIIADVPCSSSGTWSRTPEQLYYFDENKINEYALLQKKIITNILPQLKPGGHLLYITCSVFKKENEEVVEYIKQNFHLVVNRMEVLKGYNKKADTMFAALLQKPL